MHGYCHCHIGVQVVHALHKGQSSDVGRLFSIYNSGFSWRAATTPPASCTVCLKQTKYNRNWAETFTLIWHPATWQWNKVVWNIIIWTNPSQQLSYANKQLKINEADFIPVQQSRWEPALGWTWMHDVPWPLMTCWHRSPMFDSLAFWEVSSRVPHTIGMNYLCLVHWSKTLATCNVMFFFADVFYFSWTWRYQWMSVEAQV